MKYILFAVFFFCMLFNSVETDAQISSTGEIVVTNTMRVHSNQAFWNKNKINPKKSDEIRNLLKLKSSGGGYRDEIVVYFLDGATEGFDGNYDAERWFSYKNYIPELYTTISTGMKMSINVLPELTEDYSIELGFKIGTVGTYTIEAVEHEGFSSQSTIFLEDLYDTLMINIRDSAYIFYSDIYYDDDRFILHFSPVVEFINEPVDSTVCSGNSSAFYLTTLGSGVVLQWQKNTGNVWENMTDDAVYSGTQNDTLLIDTTIVSMDSTLYRCLAENSNGSDTSDIVVLKVSESPVVSSPENQIVCSGSEASFSILGTGGLINYQWQKKSAADWMDVTDSIPSSNDAILNFVTDIADNGFNYRCYINNACGSDTSTSASLLVRNSYFIERDTTICLGDSILLEGFWQKSVGTFIDSLSTNLSCDSIIVTNLSLYGLPYAYAGDDVNICNSSSATLNASGGVSYFWSTSETSSEIIVNPSDTSLYYVTVTDNNGCSEVDTVAVFVGESLFFDLGSDTTICQGGSDSLFVNTGVMYEWTPTEGLSDAYIANPIAMPDSTTTYSVITEDDNGCSGSDQITIYVKDNPIATADTTQTICYGKTLKIYAGGGDTYEWSTGSITYFASVTPDVTTEYTVTVTALNGCTDDERLVISVYSQIDFNAGDDVAICFGDSAQLVVSGTNSYRWSTSEITNTIIVSPAITTLYTVTASDNDACTAIDSVEVVVTPIPDIPTVEDTTIIVGNSTPSLVATGTNVRWYADADLDSLLFTGLSFTPAVSEIGIYTFFLTDSLNGCVSLADSVNLTIDTLITGITLLGEDNAIKLYPNPARNFLNIAIDMPAQTELNITITNLENKEIYYKQYSGKIDAIQRIDLSDFAKGVYFVKITGDNYSKIEKLIVQ